VHSRFSMFLPFPCVLDFFETFEQRSRPLFRSLPLNCLTSWVRFTDPPSRAPRVSFPVCRTLFIALFSRTQKWFRALRLALRLSPRSAAPFFLRMLIEAGSFFPLSMSFFTSPRRPPSTPSQGGICSAVVPFFFLSLFIFCLRLRLPSHSAFRKTDVSSALLTFPIGQAPPPRLFI